MRKETEMLVRGGFSTLYNERVSALFSEGGTAETDEIDRLGIRWWWNDGKDGPVLTGPDWLPTISVEQDVVEI
jgi:hypothetical protein